ncbi:hypothetical protein RJ641_019391 [Dillenia turbinata]|uniref:Uncharacterized protein n=1 Tax=Dillenia turbinata TaxID=194707 RepID=A0AAN8YY47_9MAGN
METRSYRGPFYLLEMQILLMSREYVRRPNSKQPIEIDGMKIVLLDVIGSSSLDLKTDPGVPVAYPGFGAPMLTPCISYPSHSQTRQILF